MFRELSNGRFLGHPVHAMLVHFPSALFPLSLIFDLWGWLGSDPVMFRASLYCLLAGLAAGLAAAVFGVIDYLRLAEREDLFRKASWHAGLQVCVLMTLAVIAGVRFQTYPDLATPGAVQLIMTAVAVGAMLVGNYLGGDLVFRDGVGVHER